MSEEETEEVKYRRWSVNAPRAVFLLAHGLGAHTERWSAMAGFFLDKGISSYAVELGGFDIPIEGRGGDGIFRAYRDEIRRVRDIAARENPAKLIFIIGESLGALSSFLLAAKEPQSFGGLVCIAPAFANIYKPPFSEVCGILSALIFNPGKRFKLPFTSSMCTRDREYAKKMDADRREIRVGSAELISEIIISQLRARMIKKIGLPALFLLAGADSIVDSVKSRHIFNRLKAKDKEMIEFQGMYHALSIDLEKERVFGEILKWVDRRIS